MAGFRDNFPNDNTIILTPNEFADILLQDNVYTFGVLQSGIMAELAPNLRFPIKMLQDIKVYKITANRQLIRVPVLQ
jgi:hypothetical protein